VFCRYFKILIILLVAEFPVLLFAQENESLRWDEYASFKEDYHIDTILHDQFYIRIKNANFFKNNEYANEFKIGSSLSGLFLEPTIDYYAGRQTRIRAGVHFLKYNGRDDIERSVPVLTVQHSLNEHIDMVFGTLFGTVNHGLKEPIFSFEKYLIDNYENGFQFLFNYPDFVGDLWLNWEQFIQEGDPFQEKFTAGLSMCFDLYKGGNFSISLPVQTYFRHQGGQIDNSNLPAGTQSNFVQGLKMQWFSESDFIDLMVLEQDFFQFLEINPGTNIEIPYGSGNYTSLTVGTRMGDFSVAYWKAKNFTSPHGEVLFLSNSAYDPDFYMADREVLSIKYQYHYKINDFLDFILRIEPYYHFHSDRLDHSFGVSLLVDKSFFLARSLGSQ
jgi:hypothetical protein